MRILLKTAAILMGLSVLLVGLSFNVLRAQDLGPRDKASRAVATDTREVGNNINVVKLEGSIDLVLKQGPKAALTINAEQRLLVNILTLQEGNTLRIATKGLMVNVRRPMRVELTLPSLEQLHVLGSGDSVVSGFSGDALQLVIRGSGDVKFDGKYRRVAGSLSGSGDLHLATGESDSVELSVQGSGDVTASGSTKQLTAKLMGSGELLGSDLKADKADVSLMGSGDAHVFAKNEVAINVMGSGDAKIAGGPAKRNVSKMGSGDVHFE